MENWIYRKGLPKSATNINEWGKYYDNFLPDYQYYLSAELSKEAFIEYTSDFDMHLISNDSTSYFFNRKGNYDTMHEWWSMPKATDSIYIWEHSNKWVFAWYLKPKMYLFARRN